MVDFWREPTFSRYDKTGISEITSRRSVMVIWRTGSSLPNGESPTALAALTYEDRLSDARFSPVGELKYEIALHLTQKIAA